MLSLGYGFWSEWELQEKVDFDGVNKLIIVYPHVTNLDIREDVWSAWVRWDAMLDRNYNRFLQAMEREGLAPIPNGETGDFYFLANEWKLVIDFSKVAVTGVLYSRDFSTAYYTYDLVAQYPAQVSSIVNTVTKEVTNNVVTDQDKTDIIEGVTLSPEISAIYEDTSITIPQLIANIDDISSTASQYHTISNATIISGDLVSGSIADINVRDANYWTILENITNGLVVEFEFPVPDARHKSGSFEIYGSYDGKGSSHFMELWAWNTELSSWELLHTPFMANKDSSEEHSHAYREQHIDRVLNKATFRLVHNITNYSDTHDLEIDSVGMSTSVALTIPEIANAVRDTLLRTQTSKGEGDLQEYNPDMT